MTWPQNQVYSRILSTCVSTLKTAPSFMLLGHGDNPTTVTWTEKDKVCFAAVVQLELEKCPDCGTPLWWAHTAHPAVDFELEWHVCYACQSKAEMLKGIDPKPGEWATVNVIIAEDEDALPSRAVGYSMRAAPVYETGQQPREQPDSDGGIG